MKKPWRFTEPSFLSPSYLALSLVINVAICLGLGFLMAKSAVVQTVIEKLVEIKSEEKPEELDSRKTEEKKQEESKKTEREIQQVTEKIIDPIVEDLKKTLPSDAGDEQDLTELEQLIKDGIEPDAEKLARDILDNEKETPFVSEVEKRVAEIRDKAVKNLPEQVRSWSENIVNRKFAELVAPENSLDIMSADLEKKIEEIGKVAAQKAEHSAQDQLKAEGDKKTDPQSKLSTFAQENRRERLKTEFEKTLSRNLEDELEKKIQEAVSEVHDPDLQNSVNIEKVLENAMSIISGQMDKKKERLFSALTDAAAKRGASVNPGKDGEKPEGNGEAIPSLEKALGRAEAEQKEVAALAAKIGDEVKEQIEKTQAGLEGGKKEEAVRNASVPKSRELGKTEKERAEDLEKSAGMLKRLSEKAMADSDVAAKKLREAGNKLAEAAVNVRDAGKALEKGETGKAAAEAIEAAGKIAGTAQLSGEALNKLPGNFLDEADVAAGKAEKAFNEETARSMPGAISKSLDQIRFEPAAASSSLKSLSGLARGKSALNFAIRLAGEAGDETQEIAELIEMAETLKTDLKNKSGSDKSDKGKERSESSESDLPDDRVKKGFSSDSFLYRTAVDEDLYRKQVEELAGRFGALRKEQGVKSEDDSGAISPRMTAEVSRFEPPAKIIAPSSAWKFMGEIAVPKPAAVPDKRDLVKPAWIDRWFGGVPFLWFPLRIDGAFKDWSEIPLKIKTDAMDIKISYNQDGIFLAVTCRDSNPGIQTSGHYNFWEGDCLEVWFDILKDKPERIQFSKSCHQFFFWPKQTGELPGFEVGHQIKEGEASKIIPLEPLGCEGRTAITNEGYNLEIHISPHALTGFKEGIRAGRFIGFNINLNNGTGGTSYFAGTDQSETSVRPKTWGDLILLGTDGKLDAGTVGFPPTDTGIEKNDEICFLAPGQKIYIQVQDRDRNIVQNRKDKTAVAVSTSSGETELISLQETTENSGVFQAILPTRLSSENLRIHGILDLTRLPQSKKTKNNFCL